LNRLAALVRSRTPAKGDSAESERDVVDRYCRYRLLIIDEAHERGHTDYEGRTLKQIIDRRYDGKFDSLLVSNETREVFAQAVGDSVVSRIHETGSAVECDWRSFRGQPEGAK